MIAPHFHFLTLFPQAIEVWLTTSILGRARDAKVFQYTMHQLRDYSQDKHRSVDDVSYGGGGGMVFRLEPLVGAVEKLRAELGQAATMVICFSPGGTRLNAALVESLVPKENSASHFILVCGHYEGIDQRFLDNWVDLEISLGDFVLTGGELPAVAFADALIRHVEGTFADASTPKRESFSLSDREQNQKLLEYPQYTRPQEFRGHKVPDVLLSGNHRLIEDWRQDQARLKTRRQRPDLLTNEKK